MSIAALGPVHALAFLDPVFAQLRLEVRVGHLHHLHHQLCGQRVLALAQLLGAVGEVAVVAHGARALLKVLAHLSAVQVGEVDEFLLCDGGRIKAVVPNWRRLLGAQAEAVDVLGDVLGAAHLQEGLQLVLERAVQAWLASLVSIAHCMLRIDRCWVLHF